MGDKNVTRAIPVTFATLRPGKPPARLHKGRHNNERTTGSTPTRTVNGTLRAGAPQVRLNRAKGNKTVETVYSLQNGNAVWSFAKQVASMWRLLYVETRIHTNTARIWEGSNDIGTQLVQN